MQVVLALAVLRTVILGYQAMAHGGGALVAGSTLAAFVCALWLVFDLQEPQRHTYVAAVGTFGLIAIGSLLRLMAAANAPAGVVFGAAILPLLSVISLLGLVLDDDVISYIRLPPGPDSARAGTSQRPDVGEGDV